MTRQLCAVVLLVAAAVLLWLAALHIVAADDTALALALALWVTAVIIRSTPVAWRRPGPGVGP